MKKTRVQFSNAATDFYFDGSVTALKSIVDKSRAIIITDEHVHAAHQSKLKGWKIIVIKAGEQYKNQATVNEIIEQLLGFEADRKTTLIGIGGGVVTDITGYVASIYMRGVSFGFVPTTLLAMVDASIGGKNGIDVGVYKNMVGVIRQPSFLLYDTSLLKSLPDSEWINGFAEIIKHACIKDVAMFKQLQQHDLAFYQKKKMELQSLVKRNALIKIKVVKDDEFEQGDRKLLNFGHTLGHALENQYELSHGQAISIGMVYAAQLSKDINGFKKKAEVQKTLEQYGLPTDLSFDAEKVFEVLKMDKKRVSSAMNYILLEKIGKAVVAPIDLTHLKDLLERA
jgi:3-dehydroquinate synthase